MAYKADNATRAEAKLSAWRLAFPEKVSAIGAGTLGVLKYQEMLICLYRGILHEVNNTLAGVGTLAEVMKMSFSASSASTSSGFTSSNLKEKKDHGPNLDLMSSAVNRLSTLGRRARAFSDPSSSFPVNIATFVLENKDLIELILPPHQRLTFDIEGIERNLNQPSRQTSQTVSQQDCVHILSLVLMYLRESSAKKSILKVTEDTISLSFEEKTKEFLPNDVWRQVFDEVSGSGMKLKI